IDPIYGEPVQMGLINQRMRDFLDRAGSDRLTYAQQQVAWAVKDRINAIVWSSFGDLAELQSHLLEAARRLGELEVQAKREVNEEMEVDGQQEAINRDPEHEQVAEAEKGARP